MLVFLLLCKVWMTLSQFKECKKFLMKVLLLTSCGPILKQMSKDFVFHNVERDLCLGKMLLKDSYIRMISFAFTELINYVKRAILKCLMASFAQFGQHLTTFTDAAMEQVY